MSYPVVIQMIIYWTAFQNEHELLNLFLIFQHDAGI